MITLNISVAQSHSLSFCSQAAPLAPALLLPDLDKGQRLVTEPPLAPFCCETVPHLALSRPVLAWFCVPMQWSKPEVPPPLRQHASAPSCAG